MGSPISGCKKDDAIHVLVRVLGQFYDACYFLLSGHAELEQARWRALDRFDAIIHIHPSKEGRFDPFVQTSIGAIETSTSSNSTGLEDNATSNGVRQGSKDSILNFGESATIKHFPPLP
jgi:hypothetical protein